MPQSKRSPNNYHKVDQRQKNSKISHINQATTTCHAIIISFHTKNMFYSQYSNVSLHASTHAGTYVHISTQELTSRLTSCRAAALNKLIINDNKFNWVNVVRYKS